MADSNVSEFSPEAYRSIKAVREKLETGAFAKLGSAMEVVTEQAKRSGVPYLIQDCENATEGVENLVRLFNNMMEIVDSYLAKNKAKFDKYGVSM